jgi:hypothetical protein
MERRFISLDFEKGRLSAYVAIAGNRPLRVMTLDGGSGQAMRATEFDRQQLEDFRLTPTTFGRTPPETAA